MWLNLKMTMQTKTRTKFLLESKFALYTHLPSPSKMKAYLVDVEGLLQQHVQDDDEDAPGEEVWVLSGYQLVY